MPPWRCEPRRGPLPQRVARPEQVLHQRAGAATILAAPSSVCLERDWTSSVLNDVCRASTSAARSCLLKAFSQNSQP